MRNRFVHLVPVLDYLAALLWTFGLLVLMPLIVVGLDARGGHTDVSPWSFIIPAVAAFAVGLALKRRRGFRPLDSRGAMLVCALAWAVLSALGALPFYLELRIGYLDAYFETVSGFTTTGITMLRGLDRMPRSLIFWRAFIQWLGGLGILTFFLMVVSAGGSAHRLFSAESHKIFSKRPAPGLFHTLRILWAIYAGFTVLTAAALALEGLSVFDAVAHALAALSTGGYSPYHASVGYYRDAGFRHFAAIEYTIIFAMLLGGTNFFIHYRVLTGGFRALWDNLEVRLWWLMLAGATALVAVDHFVKFGFENVSDTIRNCLFQVVAIATTTGFATRDIASDYFPSLAKQAFLILMIVGGCVGSTSGGIKVLRIGVLLKMVGRQIRRAMHGHRAVNLLTVDGEIIRPEEIRRIAALFFAWVALLAFGGGVTALLSSLGPLEAASGMFSALGNIGPCYISVEAMTQLDPVIKITYLLGMLAGRLEILPILLLFSRRTWR